MSQFVVTQRFMSLATNYDVTAPGSEQVLFTIKGTLMSPTPLFSLVEGSSEKVLASLNGNFAKTQFHIVSADGKQLATVDFPAIALKKKLSLKIGDREYSADGGVSAACSSAKTAPAIPRSRSRRSAACATSSAWSPRTISLRRWACSQRSRYTRASSR